MTTVGHRPIQAPCIPNVRFKVFHSPVSVVDPRLAVDTVRGGVSRPHRRNQNGPALRTADLDVVVAEVAWPSRGRIYGARVPARRAGNSARRAPM